MSTPRRKKVSDAIRILQRKRDASARATHLKAELGMVPNSTIERKIMSTKTSIKRIALVAAAALTLGGFSAVSAQAANTYLYVYTADGISSGTGYSATGNGVAGVANSVKVRLVNYSGKDEFVSVSGGTISSSSDTNTVVSAAGNSATHPSGAPTADLTVPTPVAGTITLTLYLGTSGSGIYSTTATETVVITVGASAQSGIYSASNTTLFIGSGETTTAVSADATVSAIASAPSGGDSATASIFVNYRDGLNNAITNSALDTLTATITSGPGVINARGLATAGSGSVYDSTTAVTTGTAIIASTAANKYTVSILPDAYGRATFFVFPNGQSGVSTVTIKNTAGTVIGTKTITFYSSTVASVTATVAKAYVQGDTTAETGSVIKFLLKDASGNIMVGKSWTPTFTYSVSTLGTVSTAVGGVDTSTADSTGTVTFGWTPATAGVYGPVTVTWKDATTSTITGSFTITVSSKVAKTLTITGPASSALGDIISYTLTAKDANGYPVADGTAASSYLYSTPATGTAGVTSFDATGKTAAGVATITSAGAVVAASQATVTFTLEGTAATTDTYLDKTLAATTIAVVVPLTGASGDASLALDAANAATDAANNAYDEAQNATQAASDALAAVKALAVQVKALIALVTKIKNKVGA
jgi:trimeric autotransporter adhesin